jgi:hypothetical protein
VTSEQLAAAAARNMSISAYLEWLNRERRSGSEMTTARRSGVPVDLEEILEPAHAKTLSAFEILPLFKILCFF